MELVSETQHGSLDDHSGQSSLRTSDLAVLQIGPDCLLKHLKKFVEEILTNKIILEMAKI